ncbi:MAG: hypothetical protein HC843_04735 [Sphingomonadales bacterium]|nr:hypothetical protein [Sphingomonadales bacterium]
MTADQIQSIGAIGFVIFTAYWIIWFVLKRKSKADDDTATNTTNGPNFPLVDTDSVHYGDVSNHPDSPPINKAAVIQGVTGSGLSIDTFEYEGGSLSLENNGQDFKIKTLKKSTA